MTCQERPAFTQGAQAGSVPNTQGSPRIDSGQAATAASERGDAMATTYMLMNFEGDWDEFKPLFDSDPVGRKQTAKGHSLARSVDNPNDIFLRTEWNSAEEAKAFRERLLASGVLDRFTVKTGPVVVEVVEQET